MVSMGIFTEFAHRERKARKQGVAPTPFAKAPHQLKRTTSRLPQAWYVSLSVLLSAVLVKQG